MDTFNENGEISCKMARTKNSEPILAIQLLYLAVRSRSVLLLFVPKTTINTFSRQNLSMLLILKVYNMERNIRSGRTIGLVRYYYEYWYK